MEVPVAVDPAFPEVMAEEWVFPARDMKAAMVLTRTMQHPSMPVVAAVPVLRVLMGIILNAEPVEMVKYHR
jgi:hypothetical protein